MVFCLMMPGRCNNLTINNKYYYLTKKYIFGTCH